MDLRVVARVREVRIAEDGESEVCAVDLVRLVRGHAVERGEVLPVGRVTAG